jgi:hypothetical protein
VSATARTGAKPQFEDIGWREGGELYWVSNTLLESLSNVQMLALAESAKPIG